MSDGTKRPLLAIFWFLCLFQILTISSHTPFIVLSPWSVEHYGLLVLYLVSSLWWLERFRNKAVVSFHLALVLALMLLHPLTLYFGRDGALIVIGLYFLVALHSLTSLRKQYVLLAASLFVSCLLLEGLLSVLDDSSSEAAHDLHDYGDVMGEYGEAGFLIPNLDLEILGESGRARFITNRFGFRNEKDIDYQKPPGSYRVLLLGDSFIAGYRTDQAETFGKVLEEKLDRSLEHEPVEVLLAGAGHPGMYFELVRDHALEFHPDLIVIGITLGNDISQSYAGRRGLPFDTGVIASTWLPDDAYQPSYPAQLPLKIDRSLRSWRTYQLLSRLLWSHPIGSWNLDPPGRVHVFDAIHSLGHFYSRQSIPMVEDSYDDLLFYLYGIHSVCERNNVDLVMVLLPQRFQVSERDWRATVFAYGLDASAFDLLKPNRRILTWCRDNGVHCLDLLPELQTAPTSPLYLPLGDMHWNAEGQRLGAERLAQFLLEYFLPGSH